MTTQASDSIWYEGREYTLIDCEKGTSLIDSADFNLEPGNVISTACRRGYIAEYFVEGSRLFGQKSIETFNLKYITSKKLEMNYTGALLIAINNDGRISFSDFLSCYLDFDEAYEMYFIDGELAEITDLSDAIQEWVELEERLETDSHDKYVSEKDRIAQYHLNYEYANYKWIRRKRQK